MGLRFLRRRPDGGPEGSEPERRFGANFPRAFAYAYSNLGDEDAAQEVVGEGFSQTFVESPDLEDTDFRIELFSRLRGLCGARKRAMPLDIGLSWGERDVVTLTFDAGLDSDEVNRVLGADNAAERLTSALRKLRAASSPSSIPSFFRLS